MSGQEYAKLLKLSIKTANFPKCGNETIVWLHVQLPKTITPKEILRRQFIAEWENLILYGGAE